MLVNSLHHNFKHKNMTPPPKNNNKPIVGTQPPIQPTPCPNDLEGCTNLGKITLYAKTEDGYKNLTKLSSLSSPFNLVCLHV